MQTKLQKQKNLQQFRFLQWYDPYIRPTFSKSIALPMKYHCNKVAPFQSVAGSEDSYEEGDETESVSEETQASFFCNTECTYHSSGRQSGEK